MAAVASLWTSIISWITPTTLFLFLNMVIGTIVVTSRFNSNTRQRHQQDHHDSHGQLARAPSLLDRVKSIDFSLYKAPNHSQEQEQQSHFCQQHTEHEYYTNPVQTHQPQLWRGPSLLDRVKSINYSPYKFPSYTQEREQEQNFFQRSNETANDTNPNEPEQPQLDRAPSFLERVKSINLSSVFRSQQQETYPETETETEKEVIHKPETQTNSDHKPKRSKSETTKKDKPREQENMKKSVSGKLMVEKEEARESVERREPQTARLERTVTIGDGDHGVDAKADDFINKFKRQLRLQRLDSLLRYKEMLQGR